MHRVLKPEGNLLFAEHGAAPDLSTARRQNLLNPLWKRIGGGCNLNRIFLPCLRKRDSRDGMSEGYQEGWRPASYHYWGIARKSLDF